MRSLGVGYSDSAIRAPMVCYTDSGRQVGSMNGSIFTDRQLPVPSVAPHSVMQGSIFTDRQLPVPSVAPHSVMQGSIFTDQQLPVPSVAPHSVMQGSIFTDRQLPVPSVAPHSVMQGSIFTDREMPYPSVAPHSVMQGTMSRSGSLGRGGYDILNGDHAPMGVSLYAKALGALDKNAAQANKCSKEHTPLRKKLAASMAVIIRTLGFPDGSQEGQRCYFRLGEILARADKNILALGWGYAGPSTNEPDKKGQEGTDFRSADNSKKKAKGHQGRIEDEKKKSSGTGRMCQMSNLLKSTISVCDILATQFTGRSPEECQQTFSSMMQYYLSPDPKAAAWAKGMEFLPPGAEYSPPEALGGVKKAGLKKAKGAWATAGKAAGGLASKALNRATGGLASDALKLVGLKDAKKKKKVLAKFAGDKGLSVDSAKEAFAQIAEEALTSGDPTAAAEEPAAEAAAIPPTSPPGAPSSKTGLIVLGAAAIGAFLLLKS